MRNGSKINLLGAVAALTIAAAPAMAATQLSVYDSNNKLVGPLVGEDTVVVTLGGFQQYLTIGQNSYAQNADFYFPDPACKAPNPLVAYDSWAELFPHAVYDGTNLYYLDPRKDAGYAVQSKLENGQCVKLPDNQTLVSTVATPVASPWTPPFSVK